MAKVKKKVIITGASRGLGYYCAIKLQETGYEVIGLARSMPDNPPFEVHYCDVASADSVQVALKPFQRDKSLFALVNAAGVASMNLTMSTPPETIMRIININLIGTILCNQAVIPAFVRNKNGRIVNFSSIAVSLSLKGEAVYVASKAGVEGFSRAFAREMADHGCTVNCIAPGPIDTDLIAKVPREKLDAIINQQIIQRRGQPDDVWNILKLILAPESSMITGKIFHVGGV